jgi:hypothetical protein
MEKLSMPTEAELIQALTRSVGDLTQQVRNLIQLITGDPFVADDGGMKGTLKDLGKEMVKFDATEFKLNTAYRKRKEAELSRLWVAVIILFLNFIMSGVGFLVINSTGGK